MIRRVAIQSARRAATAPHHHHHHQQQQLLLRSSAAPSSFAPHHRHHLCAPAAASFSSSSTTKSTSPPAPAATVPPPLSTTADEETAEQADEKRLPNNGNEVAFPWRSAPYEDLPFFEMLSKTCSEFLPQAYIGSVFHAAMGSLMGIRRHDTPEVLLRSTRFAFIQAVRAIFDGKCKTPSPTWEYNNEENKASEEWELGYPPLQAMMDRKVVEVYEHVSARFRANKREVKYELENIETIDINDFKLVLGPPRETPFPAGATIHDRWGVIVIACTPPSIEEEVGGEGFQPLGEWGQSIYHKIRPQVTPNFHYIFSMAVTFRCQELFVIKDEETQEVVQGEDALVERDHKVRFEIQFDSHAKLAKDWRIIDVDDWLEGNEYLAQVPDGGGVPPGPGGSAEEEEKR